MGEAASVLFEEFHLDKSLVMKIFPLYIYAGSELEKNNLSTEKALM